MSEHDDGLRRALEENARLRSEREESLREVASSEYSGRVRFAERIYWAYAIVCVALGVSAYHSFAQSFDVKTLLICAVVLLVVYETTVLLKLWFAIARMKMDVLKDVKLLRLEVAQMATAVGVENPSEPPVKYEPMRGVSGWERKLWLAACIAAAIAISTWSQEVEPRRTSLSAKSRVTLAADGSASVVTDVTKSHSMFSERTFSYHAPTQHVLRWIDSQGHELSVDVRPQGTHNRYDVEVTKGAVSEGQVRYTRIGTIPQAACEDGDVWTYEANTEYGHECNEFTETVVLPMGAELLSTNPAPTVQLDEGGRTAARFQGTRDKNEKFIYSVRYKLPSEEKEK